jgi:hypothetical protein
VTSTNLAHTASYCLRASFKTMAERYHKTHSKTVPLYFPTSTPGNTVSKLLLSRLARNHSGGTKDARNLRRRPVNVLYLLLYHIYPPKRMSARCPLVFRLGAFVSTLFVLWKASSQPPAPTSLPTVSRGAADSRARVPQSVPNEDVAP